MITLIQTKLLVYKVSENYLFFFNKISKINKYKKIYLHIYLIIITDKY